MFIRSSLPAKMPEEGGFVWFFNQKSVVCLVVGFLSTGPSWSIRARTRQLNTVYETRDEAYIYELKSYDLNSNTQ